VGIRVGEAAERRSRWVTPPRLRTVASGDGERHASWLELFFDLVFVVAITQLAHELELDHSARGFLIFVGLFVPVYVAWQGFSLYADRFDTDDLVMRVVFFAAMLAIAALSVQIPDVAHGEGSVGFVLAYVTLRTLMLGLYWRAWRAVPQARPLIRVYGSGYAVGAAIWLASLAVDPPGRYVVWAIALTLELSLPPLTTRIHRRVPTSGGHVPERWALFTMIVIGESVVAVALGTAGSEWAFASAAAAVLGFAAVAAAWWLYFDSQADVVLQGGTASVVVYSYAHLPLLVALAAMSAGLRLAIDHAGDDSLGTGGAAAFAGGAALFLVALVVTRTVTVTGPRRLGVSLKLATVAVLVGLIAAEALVRPAVLAGLVALALAALVFLERTVIPHGASSS
jgi:low temperature requirement protein LtrA